MDMPCDSQSTFDRIVGKSANALSNVTPNATPATSVNNPEKLLGLNKQPQASNLLVMLHHPLGLGGRVARD